MLSQRQACRHMRRYWQNSLWTVYDCSPAQAKLTVASCLYMPNCFRSLLAQGHAICEGWTAPRWPCTAAEQTAYLAVPTL